MTPGLSKGTNEGSVFAYIVGGALALTFGLYSSWGKSIKVSDPDLYRTGVKTAIVLWSIVGARVLWDTRGLWGPQLWRGIRWLLPRVWAGIIELLRLALSRRRQVNKGTTLNMPAGAVGVFTPAFQAADGSLKPGCPPLRLIPQEKRGKRRTGSEFKGKIEAAFARLGVAGVKALSVLPGPAVCRVEIALPEGTRASQLIRMDNDLAAELGVDSLRIYSVADARGRTLAVEVPFDSVEPVPFSRVLHSRELRDADVPLAVALGEAMTGETIIYDLATGPHVLIAGTTGSGKSVCLNTILCSLLYRNTPKTLRLAMVDPKFVELSIYEGIPHLVGPIVTSAEDAIKLLQRAVAEMERRYEMFKVVKVRKIDDYNRALPDAQLPYLLIVVDEWADLVVQKKYKEELEAQISRLSAKARAAGIHLLIATQRPSVDVVTGVIKANIPSRIAFAVSTGTDSGTILDRNGAETLRGKGDGLLLPLGARAPMRFQGGFLQDEAIQRIVQWWREQGTEQETLLQLPQAFPAFETGEAEEASSLTAARPETLPKEADELYEDVVRLALSRGEISVRVVQEKMGIKAERAAALVNAVGEEGWLGPARGPKPRPVLLSPEDRERRWNGDRSVSPPPAPECESDSQPSRAPVVVPSAPAPPERAAAQVPADPLYEAVVRLALAEGTISSLRIQEKFRVTPDRAAALLASLDEQEKWLGELDGGIYPVILSAEERRAKLAALLGLPDEAEISVS